MFVCFFFFCEILLLCDDLTDGAGWDDDCAAFVFCIGFDFWFRYSYEVFCHLV